jgi:type VI secretion system protein ImpC
MQFEYGRAQPEAQPEFRKTAEGPMRILLMGDLSGRSNRGLLEPGAALADRPVVQVDVDNFDDVMYRFSPRLELPLADPAGAGTPVEFRSVEDFHPDELYSKLELFGALRNTRRRLLDPGTFAQAAAELKHEARETPAGTEPAEEKLPAEDEGSMFDRLLGQRPAEPPQVRTRAGSDGGVDVSELIRRLVEPHIVPGIDPQQAQLVSSVDAVTSDRMRALLHHPAFQGLEALWRAVHWLVSEVETGEELKLFVLDVTKEELAADAGADSGLHRRLVDSSAHPWSLLVGGYTFGASAAESGLLASLGAVASRAGGAFLAGADPAIVEGDDERGGWEALRRSSVAPWIGLAMPRVLLRLPYGARTDKVERFEFEETGPGFEHSHYLWGNPGFACALLIAKAFAESGWSMQPGDVQQIDDLPAHTFDDDGEPRMKPCAEALMGEREIETILDRGIIPLASHADRNAVRVVRFQSIAAPPRALSGSWG